MKRTRLTEEQQDHNQRKRSQAHALLDKLIDRLEREMDLSGEMGVTIHSSRGKISSVVEISQLRLADPK